MVLKREDDAASASTDTTLDIDEISDFDDDNTQNAMEAESKTSSTQQTSNKPKKMLNLHSSQIPRAADDSHAVLSSAKQSRGSTNLSQTRSTLQLPTNTTPTNTSKPKSVLDDVIRRAATCSSIASPKFPPGEHPVEIALKELYDFCDSNPIPSVPSKLLSTQCDNLITNLRKVVVLYGIDEPVPSAPYAPKELDMFNQFTDEKGRSKKDTQFSDFILINSFIFFSFLFILYPPLP